MTDFPAAHSMDSQWFAVDASGRVAMFDTDEPGPAPAVDGVWCDQGLRHAALRELAEAGLAYDCADLLPAGRVARQKDAWRSTPAPEPFELSAHGTSAGGWLHSCLVWVTSDSAWDRLAERAGEALRLHVPGLEGVVGHGDLALEPLRALKAEGRLRSLLSEHELELTRFGLFEYDYRGGGEGKDPYDRTGVPRQALREDALPAEVREKVAGLRLPVDFAKDAKVQPRDHVKCTSWAE